MQQHRRRELGAVAVVRDRPARGTSTARARSPPAAGSTSPSWNPTASPRSARCCWRAHAGPGRAVDRDVDLVAARQARDTSRRASRPVRPGDIPAPTTNGTPLPSARRSRSARARTSSRSSLTETTATPASRKTDGPVGACGPPWASTTTSRSSSEVDAASGDRDRPPRRRAPPSEGDGRSAHRRHRDRRRRCGSSTLRELERAPATVLRRRSAGPLDAQHRSRQTHHEDGGECTSEELHPNAQATPLTGTAWSLRPATTEPGGGANKNRTCDLCLIRAAL